MDGSSGFVHGFSAVLEASFSDVLRRLSGGSVSHMESAEINSRRTDPRGLCG